jgi:hypothetical protein
MISDRKWKVWDTQRTGTKAIKVSFVENRQVFLGKLTLKSKSENDKEGRLKLQQKRAMRELFQCLPIKSNISFS